MNVTPAQHAQRVRNVETIAAAKRTATHCKRNHEFTPENTLIRPDDGRRECLTCKHDRSWYSERGLVFV